MMRKKQGLKHYLSYEQGRILRLYLLKLNIKFIAHFLGLALFFTVGNLFALASLKNIDYKILTDNNMQVIFNFTEPVDNVKGFDTKSPPRVVLDFFNAQSALSQNQQDVDRGMIDSYQAVDAQGRLRVVLSLKYGVSYSVTKNAGQVIVNLVAASVNAVPTSEKVQAFSQDSSGRISHQITGVDFKRNATNGGQIIIDLSDSTMGINVAEQADKIMVDFLNTALPARLQRKYDVTDFGTPVQLVSATQEGGSTKVVIQSRGDYTHTAYQVNRQFIIDINPLTPEQKAQDEEKNPQYTGKRLSLNFQNISVRAVLQLLGDFTGINIVASDTVKGDMTLRLNDVPWDEALAIILKTQGLGKKQVGNVLMIAPTEELASREKASLESQKQVEELEFLKTELMRLNYAKAADVAALLKDQSTSLLSPRGNVSVDERTNTLIVKDTTSTLVAVRQLIDKLDIPVRQVLIEARIVNVDTTYEEDLGIRWGITKPNAVSGTISGANQIQQNVIQGNPPLENVDFPSRLNVNLPASVVGVDQTPSVGIALANLGHGYLLDLELSAIENEGGGELISSPRLVTANQHPAYIESGEEIPYQEATSSGATSVEFKKAVLSLRVTPQITPDNKIIMDLKVNQDRRSLQPEVLGVPAIDTRQIETNVLVDNGETIVLGGIYEETKRHNVQRVPFLGDIPLLGALFRNSGQSDEKKELLIFITPKIIQQSSSYV
jgi:type IV pilus assembly protein PilQ